jgi:hypothetical protein
MNGIKIAGDEHEYNQSRSADSDLNYSLGEVDVA